MIKINFSSAISIYLSFSLFLVFAFWIFYNFRRNGILNEAEYLHQCPYCTYLFFDYSPEVDSPKSTSGAEKKEDTVLKTMEEETMPPSNKEASKGERTHFLVCPRCQSYINLDANDHQEEH